MINTELPVRVYWNYKHRCYSLFQAGAVRASAKSVRLERVEFRVRESGRQKMLKEGRKIIHAYAIGYVLDYVHPTDDRELPALNGLKACYNPYANGSFLDEKTGYAIHFADVVQLDMDGTHYRQHNAKVA